MSLNFKSMLWSVTLMCCLCTADASAHRLNVVTSDLQWRAESTALEVTHRLHLEDALTLLAHLGAADGVLDLESSARLLNYIERYFALTSRAGAIQLEPFGAHVQGDTLFVYQKAELAEPPVALEVQNRLLHDIEPQVRNQVNWRVGSEVRSHDGSRDNPIAWLVLAR